jgi:hypothetical protein
MAQYRIRTCPHHPIPSRPAISRSFRPRFADYVLYLTVHKSYTRYEVSAAAFSAPIFIPVGSDSNGSFWAGLDGWFESYPNIAIIQDGVYYWSIGNVGIYWAWYEYATDAPVFDTNFQVGPADTMAMWAWEGNSSCSVTVGGGYGCFWYQDGSTNPPTTVGTIPVAAPNGYFAGLTGEAVMEKPAANPINGAAWPLSPFYDSWMTVEFVDSTGADHTHSVPILTLTSH